MMATASSAVDSTSTSSSSFFPAAATATTAAAMASNTLKLAVPLPKKGSVVFHVPLGQTAGEFLYDVRVEDRNVKVAQLLHGPQEEGSVPVAAHTKVARFLADLKDDDRVFLTMDDVIVEVDVSEIHGTCCHGDEMLEGEGGVLESELKVRSG